MGNAQRTTVTREEVEASLYRPYKRWCLSDCVAVNVLLIKREHSPCIASCPTLDLVVESSDYLEASFELSRAILSKLELPLGTAVTSTCVPPFDIESGEDNGLRQPESSVVTLTGEADHKNWMTPELVTAFGMARSLPMENDGGESATESAQAHPGEEVDQFDLFS